MAKRYDKTDFPSRQRTIAHVNNGPKLLEDTQLVLLHPAYLPDLAPSDYHLFIDGPRARCTSILMKTSENDLI